MDFKKIGYERRGKTAIISIEQLEDQNRMDRKTYLETTEALRLAQEDSDIAVVIVTGSGDYFVTGGRMDGYPGGEMMEMRGFADACAGLMYQMYDLRKPLIAAVNGLCVAGGMMLLDACDLAVASENSLFGFPELARGNFPVLALAVAQRSLPKKRVFELAYLSSSIDAKKALEWDLINAVVPKEQVLEKALEWADIISERSLLTAGMGREAYHKMQGMSQVESLEYAKNVLCCMLATHDAQEVDYAIKENRKPILKGY